METIHIVPFKEEMAFMKRIVRYAMEDDSDGIERRYTDEEITKQTELVIRVLIELFYTDDDAQRFDQSALDMSPIADRFEDIFDECFAPLADAFKIHGISRIKDGAQVQIIIGEALLVIYVRSE